LSVYIYDVANLDQFREVWLYVVIFTSSLWFITWGFDVVLQFMDKEKFKDEI